MKSKISSLSAMRIALIVMIFVLPLLMPRHHVDLLVFAGIYGIAGLGVGLMLGQCGIVNLAQGLFYGIGAYSSLIGSVHWGLPVPVGFALGVAVSASVSTVLGWPILRLSGFFLALATLALSVIGSVLFFEWDSITGGSLGAGGIPKIEIFGFSLNSPIRYFYFVVTIGAILMWLASNLLAGRIGLAIKGMRDAPEAAQMLGVDGHQIRLIMFMISAVLGSIAGSLFAHYTSFISVQSFGVDRSIMFLIIPVIAGSRSVWGVVMGALFVVWVPEWLSAAGDIHRLLFGLALVAVVFFLPGGLVQLSHNLQIQFLSRRKEV
jgi:branched-chain amino acid transport system permease protein